MAAHKFREAIAAPLGWRQRPANTPTEALSVLPTSLEHVQPTCPLLVARAEVCVEKSPPGVVEGVDLVHDRAAANNRAPRVGPREDATFQISDVVEPGAQERASDATTAVAHRTVDDDGARTVRAERCDVGVVWINPLGATQMTDGEFGGRACVEEAWGLVSPSPQQRVELTDADEWDLGVRLRHGSTNGLKRDVLGETKTREPDEQDANSQGDPASARRPACM